MSIEIIPTHPGMGRSIIDHDPRNRNFPTRGALHAADAPLVEKVWRRAEAYDQGQTPMCVAYTAKGMLNTTPFSAAQSYYRRSRYSFEAFYHGAQEMDDWPGNDYDGTSGRGVLRYLQSVGIISEYRWAFGIDDALQTLSHHGPLSVGAWWRAGMWEPDPTTHLIQYEGSQVGGHQFEVFGIHPDVEEVECMNSWGRHWGDRGRFRMKFDQFEALLNDDADAHTFVTVN